MYKYLTIESIIAIKEYKSYGFSIRKIAKAIDYSKSTVHRVCRLLNQNLLPLEILNKIQKNKQNAGRKLIILTLIEINTINHLLITKNYFNYVEKYGWPKIIHQFTLKILFLIKNLLKVTLFSVKIL